MEEGSRPFTLRGTPASKHRHRVTLVVIGVSAVIGLLMEWRRTDAGYAAKLRDYKSEKTFERAFMHKSIGGVPIFTRDGALVKKSRDDEPTF